MIRNPKRTARILTLAALSASVAIVSPTQAKDQPAAPAIPNEAPQVPNPFETVVAIPVPLPLPGQLKQFPQRPPLHAAGRSHPSLPRDRVGAAMEAARVQPERTGFINAIQVFPYTEGALYQVYAKPGQVTDIALQEAQHADGGGEEAAEARIAKQHQGCGLAPPGDLPGEPAPMGAMLGEDPRVAEGCQPDPER